MRIRVPCLAVLAVLLAGCPVFTSPPEQRSGGPSGTTVRVVAPPPPEPGAAEGAR